MRTGKLVKKILLSLISFTMAGCVNFFGIHEHSAAYTVASLAVPHQYPLPAGPFVPSGEWWDMFKDPQLSRLIEVALIDSPNIQSAQSRLEKARHLAEAAGAALWPNINFSGYIRRERFSKFGIIPPPIGGTTKTLANLSLNLNYEVDFWGKNRQTLAAKISEQKAAEAELEQTRLVISTAVASSYFKLQNDLAIISLLKKILKQRQVLLDRIRLRAQHNITSAIPVSSAEIQVETWTLLLAQAQEYALIQRHQLTALMGENPFTTQISIPPFCYNQELLKFPQIMPASLLGRRPDVAAAAWRIDAARHYVKVQKALFFPDINLLAFFSFQSIGLNHLFNWNSRDYAAQAAFTYPIFDAGYLRANLKARYDEYDLAVEQFNQTVVTALQQFADQLSVLAIYQIQLKAQRRAEVISKSNYHRNYLLYKHGINDYTQVLIAQASWLYQQLFLQELQYLDIQATIGLINALGGDFVTPSSIL
jgi:NodT family efflux transporter outer membrane factor (OMF) lipoprotein